MDSLLRKSNKRRKFLKQIFTASLATLATPAVLNARTTHKEGFIPQPSGVLDESYWEMVKKQFTVPDNLIMVNAANLCPSPYFVNELVSSNFHDLEKNVSFQHREMYDEQRNKTLQALSKYLGTSVDEIGITRNTSESNNIIVNGLDLKAGDEVILWDQNHPSNGISWEQRAKRFGFTIKKVSLPQVVSTTDDIITSFTKAVTSRTRIIAFSHISNTSGIAIPAKEICRWARSKGILTHVDGAQSFGMMDLNLSDLGCDFFSGSTHKWLMGSLENGIIYVKREHLEKLWPSVISAGWKDKSTTTDEKFCKFGQRNDPSVAAIPSILDFHEMIGKKNVEERSRFLCASLRKLIQSKLPQAIFVTPPQADLNAGIVILNIPGKEPRNIFEKLYSTHGIACAPGSGVRFSPHIYNTSAEMNRIAEALVELST